MKTRSLFTLAMFLAVILRAAEPTTEEAGILSHIPRERVQSSGLTSVGYSKRRHILEIEFANGAIYRYFEVSPAVHRDLMTSESKTRYYDASIKKNYRSVRVRPRVKDQSPN